MCLLLGRLRVHTVREGLSDGQSENSCRPKIHPTSRQKLLDEVLQPRERESMAVVVQPDLVLPSPSASRVCWTRG